MEGVRRELLERALALQLSLLDENRTDPAPRREAAAAYYRVGKLRVMLGRTEEAIQAYRQAIAIRQELLQGDPGRREHVDALGEAWLRLGNLLVEVHRYSGAREAYQHVGEWLQGHGEDERQGQRYRANLAFYNQN